MFPEITCKSSHDTSPDGVYMALSIKAELNRDTIPGRFVLTGSTRYTVLQRQTSRARTSWFADYVDLVVMRDVLDIARIRQREALPRLLRQFAAQTGQLLNITKAGQAVGLESSTANRYATLLEAAFMIQRLPAWGETLGKRLSAHPKVHVIDSGLAARAQRGEDQQPGRRRPDRVRAPSVRSSNRSAGQMRWSRRP